VIWLTTLTEIEEYVQKTTNIIASVLDMQVIICDSNRLLLGDSNPNWSPYSKIINETSILSVVMETGEKITLDDIDKHYGCRHCEGRDDCEVESIVGVPIKYKGNVIGAIGILADSDKAKTDLLSKNEYYYDFVNKMCELLISKLMEKEKNLELMTLRERLLSIVDSIDGGLIALDEKGEKIHYNSNVFKFVDRTNFEEASIYELIPKAYIKDLIEFGQSFKNREAVFKKNGKSTYALISGKKIEIENKSLGYTIVFKKLTDVYDEVNNLSNNNDFIVSFKQMIGSSSEINAVKEKALTISKSNSTVLIHGESGTGKEILARAIHSNSKSKDKPFIAINCAAIPDDLLESEFFGYEEGAFTGAKKGGKIGKFQLAENGTIFLDEIGEMPLHLQSKLLRVLQERSIERLGGSECIPINVRVIAATNKNLEELIVTNEFREDLFYRLNVIPIVIPPLRDRQEDVPLLLEYFLKMYNKFLEKSIKGFTENAIGVLMNYAWKGNVRELQNFVEYTANMAKGDYITLNDISQRIKQCASMENQILETHDESKQESKRQINFRPIDEIINENIRNAVEYYGENLEGKTMAAKVLGISRATLYRKMKEENDNKRIEK